MRSSGYSFDVVRKFKSYLRYAGKSERTAHRYALIVDDFLRFAGKDHTEVSNDDIIYYYDHLTDNRGYSKRSLAVVGWALRSFFKFVGNEHLSNWVPVPSYQISNEPVWLPEDVVLKVVDRIAVLVVIYDLALRLREAKLLRTDKYNPRTGEIEVTRLKHKGRPNKYWLTLRNWAKEVLNEYIEEEDPPPDQLFTMSDRMIQYIFKKRVKEAGLDPDKYTIHCLRHSRATNIAIHELKTRGYVDIVSLAKFLGHARPETTMMYVHIATKYLKLGKQL